MTEIVEINYWLTWIAGFLVGCGVAGLISLVAGIERPVNPVSPRKSKADFQSETTTRKAGLGNFVRYVRSETHETRRK